MKKLFDYLNKGLTDLEKEKLAYNISANTPVNDLFSYYAAYYNVRREYDRLTTDFKMLYVLRVNALYIAWCHKHNSVSFKKFANELRQKYLYNYRVHGYRVKGHPSWFKKYGTLYL